MADTFSKTISCSLRDLEQLLLEASAFLEGKVSTKAEYATAISLEEMITNTIKYGYDNPAGHQIGIRIELKEATVGLTLTDDAREFNPLLAAKPDITKPVDDREIGGLGIFLVRGLVNTMNYSRLDGRNILEIEVKRNGDTIS